MIYFSKEKQKGFRGFKYTAKSYIDDKGNYITDKTPEGIEMIEIVCDIISKDDEQNVLKSLEIEILKRIKEYQPIWKN